MFRKTKRQMNGDMTVLQLVNEAENILKEGGCDSPSFDAVCIVEDIGKLARGTIPMLYDTVLPQEKQHAVLEAAKRRAAGYPLQYILGSWDFLNLTLSVGEGVLIPRPETELLCEVATQKVKEVWGDSAITVWDLCAGTGCVGLGIASLLAQDITLVEFEISEKALSYLERNVRTYKEFHAQVVKADILTDFYRFEGSVDLIVSNPPYIPTSDLNGLQREVQYEPSLALDGSEDGLRFYRAIAQNWFPKLTNGGIAAVEIGINQAEDVKTIFRNAGLIQVEAVKDFAGIERVIIGVKP